MVLRHRRPFSFQRCGRFPDLFLGRLVTRCDPLQREAVANTIRNMEAAKAGPISGRAQNVQVVQRALETRGIEFLNHGQPGVRLRASTHQTP